jgi:hypothetical protein
MVPAFGPIAGGQQAVHSRSFAFGKEPLLEKGDLIYLVRISGVLTAGGSPPPPPAAHFGWAPGRCQRSPSSRPPSEPVATAAPSLPQWAPVRSRMGPSAAHVVQPPHRPSQADCTVLHAFNEGAPKVQPAAILSPLPHAMLHSSDSTTALEAATGCDSTPSSPPLQETRSLRHEATSDHWQVTVEVGCPTSPAAAENPAP